MKIKFLVFALAILCVAGCAWVKKDVDSLMPTPGQPNITQVTIVSDEAANSKATGPVYEILQNKDGQTDMCVTFRNVMKKPADFYVDGYWQKSGTDQNVLYVRTNPINVQPDGEGVICIESPNGLGGEIEFKGTVKY